MANLQVKDIENELYESLKRLAARERRSISQEVILILEKYLSSPDRFEGNPTEAFLQLAGSWADERSADDIVEQIRGSRNSQRRFRADNELFD